MCTGTHAIHEPLSCDVYSQRSERVESVLLCPEALGSDTLHADDELVHVSLDQVSLHPLCRHMPTPGNGNSPHFSRQASNASAH